MSPLDLSAVAESCDAELSNTGYTVGFVLDMINKNSEKFVEAMGNSKVKEITATDISDGQGYASRVYRTIVQFNDKTRKPYEFILKIPTMESFEEAMRAMDLDKSSIDFWKEEFSHVHSVECDAYALITKIEGFPIPEIYFLDKGDDGKSPGMIAMESLFGVAVTIGAFKSMTSAHLLSAAKHYAHLQAELHFVDGWRGKFRSTFHTSAANDVQWPKFFKKTGEFIPGNIPNCSPKCLEYKEKLDKMLTIDINAFCQYAILELPKKYDALAFAHGDNWSNNVLIKVNEDGSVSNKIAALIDWQIAAEGRQSFSHKLSASALLDIARFVSHNSDGDIRRETETAAVDTYYEVLTEGFAAKNSKVPFTRQQATELYEVAFIHQAYEVVMMDAVITGGKDFANNPRLHEARSKKLHLRTKFVIDDALERMEKHGIFEKFKTADA